MLTALLLVSLAAPRLAEPPPRIAPRAFRNDGIPWRNSFAYTYADYELAPADSRGMGSACDCAAVTGAKGEAITWGRTSQGWCSKKGETLTGIIPGDLVACGNNLPRVEPFTAGGLALRVESLRTQLILKTEKFDDAVWTKTVTATANSVTSPANDLTADTLDDTSGAASQSASQVYVVAGTNTYTGSVYLRGGTLTSARLTISGSGGGTNTCSASLSTTTWTRLTCTASLTTNVTITVLPGSVNADQGTIYAWGAQLETGAKATSYIQADAVTVVRQADTNSVTVPLAMVPSSWAVTAEGIHTLGGNRQLWVGINVTYLRGWINGSGNWEADRDTPTIAATNGTASATGRVAGRYVTNGASATVQVCFNGSCGGVTTSNSTTAATSTSANFGYNSALGYYIDGLIGQICVDDDPARCI